MEYIKIWGIGINMELFKLIALFMIILLWIYILITTIDIIIIIIKKMKGGEK